MHAHDPLRYVGDMLAWVHQCVCGEREIVEGVLWIGDKEREEDVELVNGILDQNLESTIRPLRVLS